MNKFLPLLLCALHFPVAAQQTLTPWSRQDACNTMSQMAEPFRAVAAPADPRSPYPMNGAGASSAAEARAEALRICGRIAERSCRVLATEADCDARGKVIGGTAADQRSNPDALHLDSQGNWVRRQPPTNTSQGPDAAIASSDDRARREAAAHRCAQIAGSVYPRGGQSDLMQRAACVAYCAYTFTREKQFLEMYAANQASANEQCSVGRVSATCNDINTSACSHR